MRAGMRLGEALSRCPRSGWWLPTRCGPRRLGALAARARVDRRRGRARAPRRGLLRRAPLRGLYGEPRRCSPAPGERWRLDRERGSRRAQPPQRPRGGDADARPPAGDRGPGSAARAAARRAAGRARAPRGDRVATSWAGGRRPVSTPSSGSGYGPWASSRRCRPTRSPTASASWPAGAAAGARRRRAAAPAPPHDEIECRLGLPEAASGQQLEHALGAAGRAPARPPGAGARTIRRLRIEARLAAGGGWRCEVAMRSASPAPSGCCWRSPRGWPSFPARPRGSGCGRSSSGPRPASREHSRARRPRSGAGG